MKQVSLKERRILASEIALLNDRYVVGSGQAGFGLKTPKADMAVRCFGRPLSKISIHELPFRIVDIADFELCGSTPASHNKFAKPDFPDTGRQLPIPRTC